MVILGSHRVLAVAAAATLAIAAAVATPAPAAAAQGGEAARLERLQRLVAQQQLQIDAQARMLEALQREVKVLARAAAEASETASQAARRVTAAQPASHAQEPRRLVKSGKDSIRLSLSGQVNRGVLLTNEGHNTQIFHVDSDASSTRIRFVGTGNFNQDLSVGTQFEVQFESNSSGTINQFNSHDVGPDNFTRRKLEFYLDSKRLGRLWLGRGDTASNSTSQVNLSGSGVISSSSVSNIARAIIFSRGGAQPLAGDVTVRDAFNNLDGLSRDDRLRYDTPAFRGVKLSVSVTAGGAWDGAARYAAEILETKLAAALAVWKQVGSHGINGSISARHSSGVSLTFAAGTKDFDTVRRANSTFFYTRLGYLREILPALGDTALALDYFRGADHAAAGDQSTAYGAFIVQRIDRVATELYLGGRLYDLDRPGARFQNIVAALSGARIKF